MTSLAFKAVRHYKKWSRRFRSDFVIHQGLAIPPRHLRLCGAEFHNNDYFLSSARKEAERLIKETGLTSHSRLLDVGCGMGRLPLGIISKIGVIQSYTGIDVQKDCIEWCNRHIHPQYPNFNFIHVDVQNERYNPQGQELKSGHLFPLETGSIDIINMFSVFTHLTESHIRFYLQEFRRVLAPSGKVFLTAYVEDSVPQMVENPNGYLLRSIGPLHLVRYERKYFESMLIEFGWTVDGFHHQQEPPGQSVYYLSQANK